ncbi:MAG: hypothetical protein J0H86_02625 [Xanthomonadaceae bacterium]|nr:hypothetical protein [Xanthomonadaceae bacterium]
MSDLGCILLCLAGLLGYSALLYRVLQRRSSRHAAMAASVDRHTAARARWRA